MNLKSKADTGSRYAGNSAWRVFFHVLLWAFGDASNKTWSLGTPLFLYLLPAWVECLCQRRRGEGLEEQTVAIYSNLLSGFAGAVFAQILMIAYDLFKYYGERKALLKGIVAECDYNIGIVDEILNGAVNHRGSFKRMSVDFFRSAREGAVKYSMDEELISNLSRAIVDLELYNLEADYIFSGNESKFVYAGAIDEKPIVVERRPKEHDISTTITQANKGVTGTLRNLRKIAAMALNGGEE